MEKIFSETITGSLQLYFKIGDHHWNYNLIIRKKKRNKIEYKNTSCDAHLVSRDTFDDFAFSESNSVGRYKMLRNDTRGFYIGNLRSRNIRTSWVGLYRSGRGKSFYIIQCPKRRKVRREGYKKFDKEITITLFWLAANILPTLGSVVLCPWLLYSTPSVKAFNKKRYPSAHFNLERGIF